MSDTHEVPRPIQEECSENFSTIVTGTGWVVERAIRSAFPDRLITILKEDDFVLWSFTVGLVEALPRYLGQDSLEIVKYGRPLVELVVDYVKNPRGFVDVVKAKYAEKSETKDQGTTASHQSHCCTCTCGATEAAMKGHNGKMAIRPKI